MSARPTLPVRATFRAAAATYRAHPGRVLGIALLLLIPAEGLTALSHWVQDAVDRESVEAVLVFVLVSVGSTVAYNLGAAFYIGLLDHTVHALRHGHRPPPVGDIARRLPYWRLVGVAVLAGLAIAVGFLLLIVPGIVLMTLLAIAAPVVVLEHATVRGGLRRSAVLVRPQFWRVLLVITIPVLAESWAVDGIADAVGHGALADLAVHGVLGTLVSAYVLLLEVHTAHWLLDTDAQTAAASA